MKKKIEYKKEAVVNDLVPDLGLDIVRTSHEEFEFYNFEMNKEHFVLTYFKKLDAWTISTGSRLFTSFFDGAILSDDQKVIRFYVEKNSKKIFTSTLFLRSL